MRVHRYREQTNRFAETRTDTMVLTPAGGGPAQQLVRPRVPEEFPPLTRALPVVLLRAGHDGAGGGDGGDERRGDDGGSPSP